MLGLRRYFMDQFASEGLKGRDTVLGRLLDGNDDGALTDDDLFFFALLLLIAGNETTTNLLSGMFDTLARNPGSSTRSGRAPTSSQWQWRNTCGSPRRFRICTATPSRTTRLGTSRFPPVRASCCRSVRLTVIRGCSRARTITDRNPRTNVAFGFGAHMCLGAPLARLEAEVVLRELTKNVSKISLAGDTTWSTNSSCCAAQLTYPCS